MAEEPTLEAVTIDRAQQKISVATLGRVPQGGMAKLTERITSQFQTAQAAAAEHTCSLLSGDGDCFSCDTPLSDVERKRITIRTDGPTTTIARVTCPTAPKFWRWRDMPFPKVVPRDVEFLEHVGEIDEWKTQLAAAIFSVILYLAAKPGDVVPAFILYFIVCLVVDLQAPILWTAIAEAVDYGHVRSGKRVAGMSFGGISFCQKRG